MTPHSSSSTLCTRPATQLVVVVDTDIPTSELGTIHVRAHPVDAPADHVDGDASFEVSPSEPFVPFSFGVLPPFDDATQRVEVRVEARGRDGVAIATRLVRTGFLAHQRLRLPIFIADACRGRACAPDLDCDRGSCVPADVPVDTLTPVMPGQELTDAGSGVDVCVPVSSRAWLDLSGPMQASALTSRAGGAAGFEWWIAAADATTLHVHAIGSDGTCDRARGTFAEWMSTLAIWPLAAPNEALVMGSAVSAMVVRRGVVTEAGGLAPPSELFPGEIAGYRAYAGLGAESVVLIESTSRATGVYAVPATGAERLVTPYDLGALGAFDMAAMIPLADGGVLAGHATAEGVTLRRIAADGSLGAGFSFVPTTACGGTGCSPPGLAELSDGRIVLATSTNGSTHEVWAWLVSADLSRIEGTRMLDVGDGPFLFARGDGTIGIGFSAGRGVTLGVLQADASLAPVGPDTLVSSPGADYSRTQFARRGRATAVTYSLPTPPHSVILNVVCD